MLVFKAVIAVLFVSILYSEKGGNGGIGNRGSETVVAATRFCLLALKEGHISFCTHGF